MAEIISDCEAKELQERKENSANINNMKSTMWPTVWKKWAEAKGFSPNILSHEVKKFDMNLRRLLTEKEGKFRAMSHTEFAGIGNIPGRSFNLEKSLSVFFLKYPL